MPVSISRTCCSMGRSFLLAAGAGWLADGRIARQSWWVRLWCCMAVLGTGRQRASQAGDVLELGGNHEQLVCCPLSHLGESLYIEVLQDLGRGMGCRQGGEDHLDCLRLRPLHRYKCLAIALSLQDQRLPLALCG